ncbi:MPP/CSKP [Oopsacas minuta]|uniref:MPP/CSKP n=1 Tax=Oopsacas minuta TaxID=111878 RepID=A0A2P1GJ13_9METZ|nr:MPP/CSKP [Oopsacas minuta]KAI6654097.1 MPP/CSKP [Oopsacas minuta]
MALQNALAQIVTSLRHESQNTQKENHKDSKLQLLEDILHPNFTAIVKMYDAITTGNTPEDNIKNITDMVHEIQDDLTGSADEHDTELLNIIQKSGMKSIFECVHDISNKKFIPNYEPDKVPLEEESFDLRAVDIEFEKPNSTLGFTLKMEYGQVKVARIIQHGFVAINGILSAGDVILYVNDEKIDSNYTEIDVQALLQQATGILKMKILPSNKPPRLPMDNYFVQANFHYHTITDKLLPAKSVGLSFKKGDILQILSQEDQYWWQAKLVSRNGPTDFCGLIPSLVFEERRRAKTYKKRLRNNGDEDTTCKCYPSKMKSMKHSYSSVSTEISSTLDQYEMHLYEEVAQVPSFDRKSIVIISTPYSLRKFLVNAIVNRDTGNFLKPLEYTNNTNGLTESNIKRAYTPTEQLVSEIQSQIFLTVSKYDNFYTCIKEDSIKEIIANEKICVIDVEEQDIKLLKRVIFAPLIIQVRTQHISVLREYSNSLPHKHKLQSLSTHIKESDRILSQYGHLIDVVVDISPTRMVENILEARDKFSNGPQWVPASWVY